MSDAGRVIAGSARGTRLLSPGEGTRPLGDRVKETLFAILEPDLPGARVLDLFAGSGAGGIEALSRGAAAAVFVERDPGAAASSARTCAAPTSSSGPPWSAPTPSSTCAERAAADGPFDVVLVDPPYAEPRAPGDRPCDLAAAAAALLGPRSWVVAKHFWRTPPPQTVGLLASVRSRRFGETALTFYRQVDQSLADPPFRPEEAAR